MTLREQLILHRRGIMGTVIFHLLLAILFLCMQISRLQEHIEMVITMDTPDKEEVRHRQEEHERREEIRRRTSTEEVDRLLRSMAVNENAAAKHTAPDTRVEEYIREALDALPDHGNSDRYRPRRDARYREDSIRHDSDRRERELDSLRSTFYAGESSVSYNLPERFARHLPIPVFKCERGGTVTVEILVTPRGSVQKATVIPSRSADDEALRRVAVDAAERSRFNEKPDAPDRQKGTITYHFVKQ